MITPDHILFNILQLYLYNNQVQQLKRMNE